MRYRLPEIISKDAIYCRILPDLTQKYRYLKKDENIVISLVQTERINSNAIPLFVGMLNLLQDKKKYPIFLELTYKPRFLAFLKSIGFFSKLYDYNIIEYDESYLHELQDYDYNKDNRILFYDPIKNYSNKSKEEKKEIRDGLAEIVRSNLSSSYIFTRIKNDQLWEVTLITITETIVNAIIHSGSLSYTYIQSGIRFRDNKKGYLLSVVDVGRGFYASLEEKIQKDEEYTQEEREVFYQYANDLGIDRLNELNFLSIMEALYYSEKMDRYMNLFKMKNLLAISNANFRIHQRDKEIVFTADNCSKCEDRGILHCVECVWKKRDYKKPPIRTYPVAMAGVHIEVEFIEEN